MKTDSFELDVPTEQQEIDRLRKEKHSEIRRWLAARWKTIGVVLALLILFILAAVALLRISPSGYLASTLNPFNDGIGIGWRSDPLMQDCDGPSMKRSFPDIDYALLGYNILKGYPLAVGHDPGFTHHIFKADYSGSRQTADCRYRLPAGLDIIPDVSCVTSFSSDEVKTSYEFSRSLGGQASVSGGGWGVSFSASASYQETESVISSGETVYVISKASCNYYYMTLDFTQLPPFHDRFLLWAKRLEGSDADSAEVLEFIQYYGTHFAGQMTFGAKFIYQHKLTNTAYQELSGSEFSVGVQAGYSGVFSLSGGFGMDQQKKSAASKFSEKVETTTITVGAAPPRDGDAMTWASNVKESPVPTLYQLVGIDELFTDRHMGHANFDHCAVGRVIREAITGGVYCKKLLDKGVVDSCISRSDGWVTFNSVFIATDLSFREARETTCIEQCLQDRRCSGVNVRGARCYFQGGNDRMGSTTKIDSTGATVPTDFKLVILKSKLRHMNQTFAIENAWISSSNERDTSMAAHNESVCFNACKRDPNCDLYNYCDRSENWCKTLMKNCLIFSIDGLPNKPKLEKRSGAKFKLFG